MDGVDHVELREVFGQGKGETGYFHGDTVMAVIVGGLPGGCVWVEIPGDVDFRGNQIKRIRKLV